MDQTGITNIKVDKFSYLWTINNFTLGLQSKLHLNEALESPTFTGGKNNNLTWCFKLTKNLDFRNEFSGLEEYKLVLSLKLVSSDKTEVLAKCEFSVVNDKGEKLGLARTIKNASRFKKGSEVNYDFCRVDDFYYRYLSDEKLRIFCHISVIVVGDIEESIIKVPECQLIEDFEILFETKKFCDAILCVAEGKEIQVHKTILAARSPVFAAMFEHEMEERKLNRVNITDVDYEILHELLKFIYTGKAENLQIMAGELLAAADKYALERLKVLCEKELCANLSTENAAEILVLADLYRANQLKAQAINFINNNPKVMATRGWKKVKQTYSHLITDVYEKLLTSKMSRIGLSPK